MKERFLELREKYPEFIYESYEVYENDDCYRVTYTFKISELEFHPVVTVFKKDITNSNLNKEYLDYLFFQYGLFDLMSYYKLTCSGKIVIKPYFIDDKQADFFKKVLYNGLGEYFYKNNIELSYEEFVDVVSDSDRRYTLPVFEEEYIGNLIPIGGGKDSIVSMELLRGYKNENKLFMLERNLYPKNKAGYDSIYMAGYDDSDIVLFQNDLDLKMLELNKQGYLNVHIPISACISMASFILAYLTSRKYIVLSNEASANEGNFQGLKVNHQYSKSYEYESDFRDYAAEYLNPNIKYFSLLRGYNESEIVKLFLKNKKYLNVFRSCNVGTRENKWCSHCSKCLYVYIMLYPYLTEEELNSIFDHNLLDDASLEEYFLGLVLEDRLKPFECVGTRLEINYALQEALRTKKDLPYLLKLYRDNYMKDVISDEEVNEYWNSENFIPEEYLKILGVADEKYNL